MKTEYSLEKNPHTSILFEMSGEFGWSDLNSSPKTIRDQSTYLPCLQLQNFRLMRKITSEGRKPAMEKAIFTFPLMPFFRSLLFGHFTYTSSENPKVTSLIEGRVHRLILPLLKAPFSENMKIASPDKRWDPLCIFFFLTKHLRRMAFGVRSPPRRSQKLIFRRSTFGHLFDFNSIAVLRL